jgi:hypothetical protein
MTNLLTELYDLIVDVVDRTYYEEAEDKTVFPYAVYKCPTTTGIGHYTQGRDDVILEIDLFDDLTDQTRIENLARTLDVALNGRRVNTDNVKMRLDKLTILNIPDPDGFKRRQLRYRVIAYQID